MRRSAIIIIVLVSLFTILLGIDYMKEKVEVLSTKTDANLFKEEYEGFNHTINSNNNKEYPLMELPKENAIKYSNYDEIFKVLDGGTGVIYLGFPECPWCRNAIPVLLEAAKESVIDTIYYLNIKEDRDLRTLDENNKVIIDKEGSANYYKLLEKLAPVLDDYIITSNSGIEVNTNVKRIYLPLIIFVRNGEVVGTHLATVESQEDPYQLLTDTQKSELLMIYINNMNLVNGEVCDENC